MSKAPNCIASGFVWVSVLAGLPGAATAQTPAAAAAGDDIVFSFQPPEGLRVRIAVTEQRDWQVEGREPQRDETQSVTEGVFKRIGDRYEYTSRTHSIVMRRNGSVLEDPARGLLDALRVTIVVSPGGEALEVSGFGEFERAMQSSLPPKLAAAMAPLFNEAELVALQKDEWNARFAAYAGGRFKAGQAIDTQRPYRLPDGSTITYAIRTVFKSWEPCPTGRCVRLEQVHESESSAPAAPDVPASGRISGTLTRLIDPRTMLIHSEQLKQRITMLRSAQGALPSVTQQTRSYAYTYD